MGDVIMPAPVRKLGDQQQTSNVPMGGSVAFRVFLAGAGLGDWARKRAMRCPKVFKESRLGSSTPCGGFRRRPFRVSNSDSVPS